MGESVRFDEVLDAVERLPPDEQEELVEIIRHRLTEARRERLANEVRQARDEYAAGGSRTADPDDLMREILS